MKIYLITARWDMIGKDNVEEITKKWLEDNNLISEAKLPFKFFAYTPCYRKEAGSYRAEERGMIRGHQFNKVEMVQYAHPEKSMEAFNELVDKAASLIEKLGYNNFNNETKIS